VVPIDKKQMSLGLFSIGEAPSHTLITTKWTGLESCSYVLKRRRGVSFFKRIKIVYDHNHSCEIKATQTARCANCEVWSSGKNGNHNDEMEVCPMRSIPYAKYGPQGRMATITTKWTGLETGMFSKPLQTVSKSLTCFVYSECF